MINQCRSNKIVILNALTVTCCLTGIYPQPKPMLSLSVWPLSKSHGYFNDMISNIHILTQYFQVTGICLCLSESISKAISNRVCHPDNYYWNYSPGALSLSQVTAIYLNNGLTCAGRLKLTRASVSGLGCFLCEILKFRQ